MKKIFLFEPTNSGLATMMISSGAYMREGSGPDFVFQGNAREVGEDITGIQFWTDALVNRISYTIYGLEEV
jgi:hypothetical protein